MVLFWFPCKGHTDRLTQTHVTKNVNLLGWLLSTNFKQRLPTPCSQFRPCRASQHHPKNPKNVSHLNCTMIDKISQRKKFSSTWVGIFCAQCQATLETRQREEHGQLWPGKFFLANPTWFPCARPVDWPTKNWITKKVNLLGRLLMKDSRLNWVP